MSLRSHPRPLLQPALEALQCAATLVAILAVIGGVAWAAGIAAPSDLPWVLAGAFGGSFVMALFRGDARRPRASGR